MNRISELIKKSRKKLLKYTMFSLLTFIVSFTLIFSVNFLTLLFTIISIISFITTIIGSFVLIYSWIIIGKVNEKIDLVKDIDSKLDNIKTYNENKNKIKDNLVSKKSVFQKRLEDMTKQRNNN
jgi:glucan phosphoethanolaminetransferase (alkaline phosphatase superfamily)